MTKTVKLQEPIQFGSDTITEISIRKPKAKDLRNFPMDPKMGDVIDLAGKLASQPPRVMDELGIEDFMQVAEIIGDFLPSGLGTGKQD